MAALERDNPSLKGVLPRDYGRPGLDKSRRRAHGVPPAGNANYAWVEEFVR